MCLCNDIQSVKHFPQMLHIMLSMNDPNLSENFHSTMDVLINNFLSSFNKNDGQSYETLLYYLQSHLTVQYTKEQEIIRQMQQQLSIQDQQRLKVLLQKLQVLPLKFRTNILYVFQQLQKLGNQQEAQIRVLDFDFSQLRQKRPDQTKNVPEISPSAFNSAEMDIQKALSQVIKEEQIKNPTIPLMRNYLHDVLFIIQGLHGQYLSYTINIKTDQFVLVPKSETIRFYPIQLSFLLLYQQLGRDYVNLNKKLKQLLAKSKQCSYKRQFNEFCVNVIQNRYLSQISQIQSNIASYNYINLSNKVKYDLSPLINFLTLLTNNIVTNNYYNIQLLYCNTPYQFVFKTLYQEYLRFIQEILKSQVKRLIFDKLNTQETFFLTILPNPDFSTLQTVVVENDVLLKAATSDEKKALQIDTLQHIVYNLQYIKVQLNKIIDFDAFQGCQTLKTQLDDKSTPLEAIDLTPLLHFTNSIINQHLITTSLILPQLVLVTQAMFGLKGDFITQFVLLNQTTLPSSLYQLHCDKEIDYTCEQYIIQNNKILTNLTANEQKQIMSHLSADINQNKEFYIQFSSKELKIIMSEDIEKALNKVFRICYKLRQSELYLSSQLKSEGKRYGPKTHQIMLFKLTQAYYIISNYLQLVLSKYEQDIISVFKKQNNNYIEDLKQRFQEFHESVSIEILHQNFLETLLADNHNLLTQYCQSMENRISQVKNQPNNLSAYKEIQTLQQIFTRQININFQVFQTNMRTLRNPQLEALLERMQTIIL